VAQWLAGAEGTAVLVLHSHLLLEQKVHQIGIGGELETQRFDHLVEKIPQRMLP
jgi:hypothetical protein